MVKGASRGTCYNLNPVVMSLLRFCNLVNKRGGASYSLETGELNPTTGYMVSLKGFEFKAMHDPAFVQAQVKQYLVRYVQDLIHSRRYLGAWVDEGSLVLDVSVNVLFLPDAIELAQREEQKAIYDCANGQNLFIADFIKKVA